MWNSIKDLVDEIKTCEKAGATTSAVAMAFVCIDTMSYLSLPSDRETQGKSDFINWVKAYLKGHEDHSTGLDPVFAGSLFCLRHALRRFAI